MPTVVPADVQERICHALAHVGTPDELRAFRLATQATARAAEAHLFRSVTFKNTGHSSRVTDRLAAFVRLCVMKPSLACRICVIHLVFDGWEEWEDLWVKSHVFHAFSTLIANINVGHPLSLHVSRREDNRSINGGILADALIPISHCVSSLHLSDVEHLPPSLFTHFPQLATLVVSGVVLDGNLPSPGPLSYRPSLTAIQYSGRPPAVMFDSASTKHDPLLSLFDLSHLRSIRCDTDFVRDNLFLMSVPNLAFRSLKRLEIDSSGLYVLPYSSHSE
jgi:hypothetical protein